MPQARPKKKSPAQLNREIAETLARRGSSKSRRHHATMQGASVTSASDTWDVAMDALLEHDAARAADLVLDIKRTHGLATMTPAFSKALNKVPENVRHNFEQQAGVVSKKNYDWSAFVEGATSAFWGDAYSTEVENLEYDETRRALSPRSGGRWEDVMPDPPPAARALAKKFTKATRDKITDGELNEVAAKFSAEKAGYYGAMQSLGHGVGWGDEGVRARPPGGFSYDPKLSNAVWTAVRRAAREAEVPL